MPSIDRRSAASTCRLARALCLAGAVVLAAGCDQPLDTDYGAVRGPSINGVSAFVQLLRDAGHPATATSRLPAADDEPGAVLVAFADGFGPLPEATVDRLQRFLDAGGPRTLVIACRDDDCAIGYWRALATRPDLDAPRRRLVADRLDAAREAVDAERAAAAPATAFGSTLEPVDREAAPGPLRVDVRSAGGFADDAVTARWDLHRRLVPARGASVLWRAGADPLLVRTQQGSREILVVASATPLLNGGLVDPGNRRLAEDLVGRLPAGARVHVAGSAAAPDDGEDGAEEPSILRLLAISPHPWIAVQALAAMALFCWWRAPIVGRPRREQVGLVQDFGHHVAALGTLLARARGDAFAERRLEEWRRLAAPTATRRRVRRS